jgi:hypothetical protein
MGQMSRKITKRLVEQEIDLEEFFGVDFTGKPGLREIIGEKIIERIRQRVQEEGRGFNGRPLKRPYSDDYSESAEFKAFGKSKSDVNMTLTGDMLGLMDITKQSANTVTIGWRDSEQELKAFNHITGDTVPRRDFFGINKTEMREIVREMREEVKEATKIFEERGRSEAEDFLVSLADRILSDPED